ncbi:non-specific lipid transfer protein GPI-anchored 29-like [Lolium rigidum]|uniref:non-specific lipid transfer protein GPI-anchored 29-like n=1 Tax=Lolium rigidum TaxID=89674 RepID=UPI001F5DEF0E|nr:non-specific lipid transfer protein GPI-anchored 29-like [Lolium rigidum]
MILQKPPQHFHCRSPHAAAALHLLLLLGAALAMASRTASAHGVHAPCCNLLQGVNLVPCLSMAGSGGAVNISAACCASLNQALDAGRRCVCSLLLANGVLAGLVAALIPTLPLVLPLPGCYLYAPPLAACQVTLLQTNYESPAAASAAPGAVGDAAGGSTDSPPPQAAAALIPKNGSAAGTTDGSAGNGSRVESLRRSDASRRPGVGEGRTYYVLIPVVVMAVFWFSYAVGS